MGNLSNALKRFIANKNTVTILGVLLGIVVLYFGYQYRVTAATTPVTVPVAKNEILPKTKVTNDMITTIKITKNEIGKLDNVILNKSQIINKFVKYGYTIPKNGLFYIDNIVEGSAMPNSIFADIPDGYLPFSLQVNSVSDIDVTYGNSIMPGDYIDIFLRAVLTEGPNKGKIYYGRLIRSIEVLAVRDSAGNNVFEGGNLGKAQAYVFAVDESMHKLLTNAVSASTKSGARMDLIPMPKNKKYTDAEGKTEYASQDLITYIESFVAPIGDEGYIEQ